MIEDSTVQVPYIPETLPQDIRGRCCCRTTEEHHQDFAEEDSDSLAPSDFVVRMAVAGDVGLVDQNGREGSHDGVDGLDHRPDQVGAAQLFRPGSVAELADFAAVGADRPGQDAEEGDCGVDCFDDE